MKKIELSHGAGGKAMQSLLKQYILSAFTNQKAEVPLQALEDSAIVDDIVFTTDSHTVQPIFFPNGNIGSLAIAGTINDISVMGGKPLALSSAMVIQEGFLLDDFKRILDSMAQVAGEADVEIITGDTKVVEREGLKDMIITTSAIGKASQYLQYNLTQAGLPNNRWLLDSALRPGDVLIINGPIADHGIAIISKRDDYGFESSIMSDVAPLNGLIEEGLKVGGIVSAKDVTRGGLANALNEMAEKSCVGITVNESAIPINTNTFAACEMLGLDPYSIGNEGKVIFGVSNDKADEVLTILKRHKYGRHASIIGEVVKGKRVILETDVGGQRILDAPVGDPIPRIC